MPASILSTSNRVVSAAGPLVAESQTSSAAPGACRLCVFMLLSHEYNFGTFHGKILAEPQLSAADDITI